MFVSENSDESVESLVVRVECTPSDMLVTMVFGLPFNGRVYATGNSQVITFSRAFFLSVCLTSLFFDIVTGLLRNGKRATPNGPSHSSGYSVRNSATGMELLCVFLHGIGSSLKCELVGILKSRGRYVNHVVVQQNQVIMQESDSTIRVECTFDTAEQTVSYAAGGRHDGYEYLGYGGIDVTLVHCVF